MIDYETFGRLRQLYDQKSLKVSQIAVELQLDPKTVEQWIDRPTYQRRQGRRRASKLDSFKGQIAALLERHPYSAQQLLQQLRQQGYAGGYSILKEFVRQVRPVRKPAYLMLDFAPGECAQVDWGSFGSVPVGSTRRRLSFFVMVLCYSRMMYVEFTLSEGMEPFLSCHRHAFEFFQGTTARVMIDNLKVGVLRHPSGQKALFHPRYLDLAAHYGFEPVACAVRKANEKGRVENGVGYVKKNFLSGLEIPSFAAVNPAALQWRDTVANVRIHGETHRKPLDLFSAEKPRLKPLPVMPYDCAVVRPISANGCCHVVLDTNRYSVPHLYASQQLTLKLYPDQVLLFHYEKLIATHARTYDRHMKPNPSLLPQHLEYLKLPFLQKHHSELAQQAADQSWYPVEYLRRLIEGEYTERRQRVIERRLKAARFPVIKTLDPFRWDWPKKINRLAVQNLFRLEFLKQQVNVVLLGNVGLGKTHLATALGYAACQEGYAVLFADAISVINDLSAAQKRGLLKRQLKRYLSPELLLLDEIGYLPIDQHGADLLFQVISQRYERGSIVLTTNKPFKQWASIFNNDSTIASAVLDRLLHHAETIVIEGGSYRMKDQSNP